MESLQKAINANRELAHELVTPDFADGVLKRSLVTLADSMLRPAGIQTQINDSDFDDSLPNKKQQLAVYRIAQEQCNNIIKHAHASHVSFTLITRDGVFSFFIQDDGKGMQSDAVAAGIGLHNIKARTTLLGGKLLINSAPGKGFSLEIFFPV